MCQKFKLFFCVIKNLIALKKMEPIPMRRLHIVSTAIRIAMAGVSSQEARQYINYVVDFVSRSQSHKNKLSPQSIFWLKKPPSDITVSQAILLLKRNAGYTCDVINVTGIPPQEAQQYIGYVADFVSKSQSCENKLPLQPMFWLKKPATATTVDQVIILLRKNAEDIIDVLFSLVITMLMICIFSKLGWDGEQLKECLIDQS